jgi:small-conductance mechanosensitive channel
LHCWETGIAMGLAAKEVVSNFFGGAVLLITQPFVIGDRIKAGSFAGQVQDIGYLQTKILGFDGVPILVPNQAFINQVWLVCNAHALTFWQGV